MNRLLGALIEWCARHRYTVIAASLVAAAVGYLSLRAVPVDAIPDLSDPQVVVFTEWMGRSPTLVEDQVTYPITSGLLAAPKVTDVRGVSMFGMSFVYVLFEEGTDVYWARSRVLEYLQTLQRRLPPGVSPTLGPDATGVGWVYQYVLVDTSGRHDVADLRTFQDFSLRYALESVPGVAEVASVGGFEKQYQVTVDPRRLQALELSLGDVAQAIRRSNAEVGGRVLEMSGREYYIRGRGYLQDLGALGKVVVKASSIGAPVRLSDIATLSFGGNIRRGAADLDGEGEVVGGTVVARYGENARALITRIEQKLQEVKPSLPEGVEVRPVYDRSVLIDHAVGTLHRTLFEEALVVSLIIFAFLLHVRSALVAILTLPVAILLAFVPMHALGLSTNIMSLGGIAIAIGAMVDAAIVLVENAHKHLEVLPEDAGEAERLKAITAACREVGPPIFFSLLIITAAFVPIFALNGQAGRLFHPLAYTKTFSMGFAALLSVTLAPALIALLIRGRIVPEHRHPVSRGLIALYKPFVYVALRKPKTTLAIGVLAVISALPLIPRLGSEFMPALDEGDLLFMPVTMPNISIEEARRALQVQDRLLRGFPEVVSVFGKVGRAETATDPAPLSMVETVVRLKPHGEWRKVKVERFYSHWPGWLKAPLRPLLPEERQRTTEELIAEMNTALQLPGWTNAFTMPIKNRLDMLTTGIRTPVGVKVFGTDLAEIERAGEELERVLATIPGTRSAFYERSQGGLYVDIIPNRDALARYGMTVGDLNDVIEGAIGGEPVTMTVEGRSRFSVSVRYPRDVRSDVERLRQVLIPVRGATGAMGTSGMGQTGFDVRHLLSGPFALAQADMGGMGRATGAAPGMGGGSELRLPERPKAMASDNGMGMRPIPPGGAMVPPGQGMAPASPTPPGAAPAARTFIPLSALAEVKVVQGPPMLRDEAGLLVGYVYVDVDTSARDVGGYVHSAKAAVESAVQDGRLRLPRGGYLKWTGQYEMLEKMMARMQWVVPLTLLLVVLLLVANFKHLTEALIVLLSVPFALVGSVWLMWLLDYRLSTASYVGLIAMVGLAAETGIVMIVYLDAAFERRLHAGKVRDLNDIIWAHMEGTVQRVRPKLMTVSTMLFGLVPLLWSHGTGADVMKRIAAPMVGGLLSSAFLTLEIIPVVYTYWRLWQLRHGRLHLTSQEGAPSASER
ncbi:efflux RND transporter permease subunit [Myxococcus sp. AM011]|uniref:efflux RND transporter permease subunit n=1 Tax=Myxococcus sp. AM011 TaxID=2745200 RepID=UPI001594F528|nr:CusA/CzcA family heavy metal efflux RND transporter [Myxococcus sp. AM011]NVJ25319.1 efflux RND transporter permease subunit [Myxococcus sp. AM011]